MEFLATKEASRMASQTGFETTADQNVEEEEDDDDADEGLMENIDDGVSEEDIEADAVKRENDEDTVEEKSL